jgi:hypothetical protein
MTLELEADVAVLERPVVTIVRIVQPARGEGSLRRHGIA